MSFLTYTLHAVHLDEGWVQPVMQVLLVQGLTPEQRESVVKGPNHDGPHLTNAVKFVAAKVTREGEKRGILSALGGFVDPRLDGHADPAR